MKKLILGLMAATMLSGCYSQTYGVDPTDATFVNMSQQKKTKGQPFKREARGWWILNGMVPVVTPDVSEMIKAEAVGKPVQNVRITTEMTMADFLLTYGTMGGVIGLVSVLYNGNLAVVYPAAIASYLTLPQYRTVTVEGEVLKKAGSSSGGSNDYTGDDDE